ncbi:hypothetical protein RB195_002503 [Necator americanus]|uniref:Ion transport domain-containing protein n=1 Tax=Necator americanus TaxID=51031 RepID=A0ABR1DJC3_NECAM
MSDVSNSFSAWETLPEDEPPLCIAVRRPVSPPRHYEAVYATATYPTYPNSGGGITVESRTVVREGGEQQVEMTEHPVFTWVENVCVIYFSMEYMLRFLVAPRKLAFARQFLNVIDLLSIAPFYFEMLLWLCGISGENVRKVRWAFLTVRLLRVLRVIRIAKLGRFSPGLANFALTIRKSKKQMQMRRTGHEVYQHTSHILVVCCNDGHCGIR